MRITAIGVVVALAGCDVVFGLERDPPAPDAPLPAERWLAVSGGAFHTCGIRVDHTLWCWGRNDAGQLGARESLADWEVTEPRQVGAEASWDQLSARDGSTCAITTDHRMFCWGDNQWGELGVGDTMPRDTLQPIDGSWLRVAMGVQHACAIDTDGQLWCWGDNTFRALGVGAATGPSPSPVLVAAAGPWADVAAGAWHSCARKADDGSIWCWGTNAYGQIGVPGVNPVDPPMRAGTASYTKLAVGEFATCGLEAAGTIDCWGLNSLGQVGDGTGMIAVTPAPVGQDQFTDFVDLASGLKHTCALRAGGEVLCWGSNEHRQLGIEQAVFRGVPTAIAGTWGGIAGVGDRSTCLLDAERRLFCAGFGPAGGLGTGVGSEREPRPLAAAFDQISAGYVSTCARKGSVIACWGTNARGAVGDTTLDDRQEPVMLSGVWAQVLVADHACALDAAQHLWCWGSNVWSQLGQDDQVDRAQATVVGGLSSTWKAIAVSQHTVALALDGSLYAWGSNTFGQTGFPASTFVGTPMRSQLATYYKAVSAGAFHTCGLSPTGGVTCWGYNVQGELGVQGPSMTTTPQPVMVAGNPAFDAITSGERYTCARAATVVWCWGANDFGQLGNQTTVLAQTPIRLAGVWQEISAGQFHACGIKVTGTLWCWGQNRYGQLGIGSFFEQHEPTQVGSDADWVSVSAGKSHTCARKAGGEAYCWGSNLGGELGTGTAWRATFEEVTR